MIYQRELLSGIDWPWLKFESGQYASMGPDSLDWIETKLEAIIPNKLKR